MDKLDEAIEHYEKISQEYERSKFLTEQFTQLAEWLKELKGLLENEDVKDVFENCDTCKYIKLNADDYPCDRCMHRYINQYVYDDKREANADADSD